MKLEPLRGQCEKMGGGGGWGVMRPLFIAMNVVLFVLTKFYIIFAIYNDFIQMCYGHYLQ